MASGGLLRGGLCSGCATLRRRRLGLEPLFFEQRLPVALDPGRKTFAKAARAQLGDELRHPRRSRARALGQEECDDALQDTAHQHASCLRQGATAQLHLMRTETGCVFVDAVPSQSHAAARQLESLDDRRADVRDERTDAEHLEQHDASLETHFSAEHRARNRADPQRKRPQRGTARRAERSGPCDNREAEQQARNEAVRDRTQLHARGAHDLLNGVILCHSQRIAHGFNALDQVDVQKRKRIDLATRRRVRMWNVL